MNEQIVIAGAVAGKPGNGGHSWVFLQYLLGFRGLGYEVLLLDSWQPDPANPLQDSLQWEYLRRIAQGFGLEGSVCLLDRSGGPALGISREEALQRVRRSVLFLNIMGYCDDAEILSAAPCKAFLDIDPGFTQIWQHQGLADLLSGQDRFFSVGWNIGRAGCSIPDCGLNWIPLLPPVALDEWPAAAQHQRPFTSVARWRGAYGPLQWEGKTLGLRVHEFRRFADLPQASGARFQVALQIDPEDQSDIEMLRGKGWELIPPAQVAADPWAYREFIQQSQAEFSAAKSIYVQTRSGWFSDRSACYLASGKPVLVQDTGLAGHLPVGEGLLTFSTLEEAVEGVHQIVRDYPRHARQARRIAEGFFNAETVLKELLGKAC